MKTKSNARSKKKPKGVAQKYLHGFTKSEQDRLYRQARLFEPYVYQHVDFSHCEHIIEVGCGVGAQTEILLKRFPHLKITAVDASPHQLKRAAQHLKTAIAKKRVRLVQADALKLPFEENSFDGAFVCWFLEHLPQPVPVLEEVRRTLKENAVIYCNEVMNSTFFVDPYSPATIKYWFEFNDHQWMLKGDPFVGSKLGNHLQAAGFQKITTEVLTHHFDNRTPKLRALFIDDWIQVLRSASPDLIKAKRVTPAEVRDMTAELSKLKHDPNSVFFNSWVQAKAIVL